MNNKEALQAAIEPYEASELSLTKALEDAGLDEGANYTDEKSVDIAAINILQKMLSLAGEEEGGFGKSYSVDGVKRLLLILCGKHGIAVPGIGGTIKALDLW